MVRKKGIKKKRRKINIQFDWRKVSSIIFTLFFASWILVEIAAFIYDRMTNKVAIVKISGVISNEGSFFQESNVDEIIENLKKAEEDDTVKAILLEINSPGGSVVATREISDVLENTSKLKVALIREQGTSGAYWIATYCDYIFADNFSLVGSIGVTASYLEFSGLLKKYNITYVRIVSGELKDIGSPYRKPTEEELEWFNETVKRIHREFVRVVAENRNLSIENVSKIANGRVFLGEDALKYGLIDYIGYKDDAIEFIKKKLNLTNAKMVEYGRRIGLLDLLFSYAAKLIPISTYEKTNKIKM